MKLELHKEKINNNLIYLRIKGKIINIAALIYKYILNIMKKVEFELIRNDGVYVKVTREQRMLIKKLAKCQKKSDSDFIKWLIFSKYIDEFIK